MRAGLVSDNHALVDPALPSLLAGVDEIWHAGDFVTPDIVPVLERIAPLLAVCGNNDHGSDFADFPEERVFEREGWRILLRHIVGKPGRLDPEARRSIARERPSLVVCGHSHMPMAEQKDGVLFVNPGSCGARRFRLPRAAGVLELSPREARVVLSDLDSGAVLLDRRFPRI